MPLVIDNRIFMQSISYTTLIHYYIDCFVTILVGKFDSYSLSRICKFPVLNNLANRDFNVQQDLHMLISKGNPSEHVHLAMDN